MPMPFNASWTIGTIWGSMACFLELVLSRRAAVPVEIQVAQEGIEGRLSRCMRPARICTHVLEDIRHWSISRDTWGLDAIAAPKLPGASDDHFAVGCTLLVRKPEHHGDNLLRTEAFCHC